MTIKSRLNIIVILSVGTLLILYGYLLYTTFQIDDQLNQINEIEIFNKTASELNILTEQYIAYQEPRYLESWNDLYGRLNRQSNNIKDLSEKKVISNALPSIKSAFDFIQNLKRDSAVYADPADRTRILERAQTRIRSDIQVLLSVSYNTAKEQLNIVRRLQVNRRLNLLLFLIPMVLIIGFLAFQLRKSIISSLQQLLLGTQQMADGNLNTRIETKHSDEHGELADAFNTMTLRLQKQIDRERLARQQAEENQKRWETLVEQDPNLIIIHVDGEIKFINPAGAQIIGIDDSEQLIGTSVYDLIDESQVQKARQRVNVVEKKGEAVSSTIYKINTKDNTERYVQLESIPIKYLGQDATQTVGLNVTNLIKHERELQKSVEEKTVLLQEVHHRVKNNLAVVSGLLHMQRFSTENKEVARLLEESERRIKSMALIHETLYKSSSLSLIPIDRYITKLIGSIQDSFDPDRNISLQVNSDSFDLNVNQAVPCALIVNELVSNAFEHAFTNKKNKRIDIHIREKEETVEFTISDNGKGLPSDFNPKKSETFGFTIVKTLINQLNSRLEIPNVPGATFRFAFDKKNISGASSNIIK